MDLWDVVRLMARRWYVSAPMLLLTLVMVVWTGLTVSPNHTAEAHVMVLPPVSHVSIEPGEERVLNPWTTDSLAGAIVTTLRNFNLAEQLKEEGYRAQWEVGLDLQFLSVIRIEVVSPTEHEAQAAASRLIQAVENEVSVRQDPYEITDGERITTVTLGAGENVDVVRGNQIRALVVVFGAGIILTMALTIGIDAIARRRAARAGAPPAAATGRDRGPEPLAAPPVPATARYARSNGAHDDFATASARGSATRPDSSPPARGSAARPDSSPPGITVSYRPPAEQGNAPVHPVSDSARAATDLEDSTIVLPLSGTDLRRDKRAERPSNGPDPHKAHER